MKALIAFSLFAFASGLSLVIPPMVPDAAPDYQIMRGSCGSDTLSHLEEKDSTTEDCAQICTDNEECCGFDFDRVNHDCSPKKECCQKTTRGSSFLSPDHMFHYVKLSYTTSPGGWAPSYVAVAGSCPHGDLLELGGLMNVTRCAQLCDWYQEKCAGFIIFDGHVCRLKTTVCRLPTAANPLDTLYSKKPLG